MDTQEELSETITNEESALWEDSSRSDTGQSIHASDIAASTTTETQRPPANGFAPPRKPGRAKAKAIYTEKASVDTRPAGQKSEWYENVNMKEKYARSDLQTVAYVVTLIRNCVNSGETSGDLGSSI